MDHPRVIRPESLNAFDVACLIINKMIGSGIFTTPPIVLLLIGNKWGALLLWIFGGVYTLASIYVYLEYGLAWPFTGGEFIYVTKIFPRPTIILSCSFAWSIVVFSTSTSNALVFAKYLLISTGNLNPDEWLQKFIASWIIVGISIVHYKFVTIGIGANRLLATYKTLLLGTITFAGLFGGLIREYRSQSGIEGSRDFLRTHHADDAEPVNVALAIFLVLYSYQGWENANYVTSEIKGTDAEKRQTLKRGALWAVWIVSLLYISFNLVLFLLLDFESIVSNTVDVIYSYMLKSFGMGSHPDSVRSVTFACIAISACGNLIGVTYTNARVKREIARHQLIPWSKFFSQSSGHGQSRDGFGTPSGGLLLHGVVTCATIAAAPLYNSSNGGLAFVAALWGYAHAILGGNVITSCSRHISALAANLILPTIVILGFGLFFLQKRMNENQTACLDPKDDSYDVPWEYKLLKSRWLRSCTAIFFIGMNGYLLIIPSLGRKSNTSSIIGIPSWKILAATLPVLAIGAIAGLVILLICPRVSFKTSTGPAIDEFQPHRARRWRMEFPAQGQFFATWKQRNGTCAILHEAWKRLWDGGEAAKAEELRRMTPLENVVIQTQVESN